MSSIVTLPACLSALCAVATTLSASPEARLQGRLETSFGHVVVDPDDVGRAVEEGEAARTAARDVLGLPDVRFSIVEAGSSKARWDDTAPNGEPIYTWTFRTAAGSVYAPPAHLLRHEIGHSLFIRHVVPNTRQGQYGSDAPDWLDEMAAIAFEGGSLRNLRRRQTAELVREGRLMPLRRFLRMDHPELSNADMWRPSEASPDRPAPFREAASKDTGAYYAVACAFHDYLVARTGDVAIIAGLGAAFRRGAPLEEELFARTRTSALAELDQKFRAWIAADPRYASAGR